MCVWLVHILHYLVASHMYFVWAADAGKSTTGGQILFLSGQVDDRTIQKYEKEAKDKSRESWYALFWLSIKSSSLVHVLWKNL